MNLETLLAKLTSRKFLLVVAGILTTVASRQGGVISGEDMILAILAQVVAYLAAEGYIDGKAAGQSE